MSKKITYIFFLFLFSVNLSATGPEEYIKQGDSYYQNFDLINAINMYEEAYKLAPENYTVLLKITRGYNDLAEYYYEKRDEINSEKTILKALTLAEKFAGFYPDSAMVYSLLSMSYGNLALHKGGNEKVKLAYKIKENAEKSLSLKPDNYLAYIILGIWHRQIASINWFERAFANTFYGDIPEGSLEESEKMLIKALSIKPGVIIAMFHLSLTYREMDEEEKEIQILEKILALPEKDFRDKYAKRKAKERLEDLL